MSIKKEIDGSNGLVFDSKLCIILCLKAPGC